MGHATIAHLGIRLFDSRPLTHDLGKRRGVQPMRQQRLRQTASASVDRGATREKTMTSCEGDARERHAP